MRKKRNKPEEAKEKKQLWAKIKRRHPNGVSVLCWILSTTKGFKRQLRAETGQDVPWPRSVTFRSSHTWKTALKLPGPLFYMMPEPLAQHLPPWCTDPTTARSPECKANCSMRQSNAQLHQPLSLSPKLQALSSASLSLLKAPGNFTRFTCVCCATVRLPIVYVWVIFTLVMVF